MKLPKDVRETLKRIETLGARSSAFHRQAGAIAEKINKLCDEAGSLCDKYDGTKYEEHIRYAIYNHLGCEP